MKKQLTSILLAVSMTAAFPALAANTNGGTTEIITNIEPAYSVTIPDMLEIPYHSDAAQKLTLTASGILLEAKKTVKVSASGSGVSGAFTMANGGNVLAYELSANSSPWSAAAPGEQVAQFTEDGAKDVFVSVPDWTAKQAGRYSGTVTFTISYS